MLKFNFFFSFKNMGTGGLKLSQHNQTNGNFDDIEQQNQNYVLPKKDFYKQQKEIFQENNGSETRKNEILQKDMKVERNDVHTIQSSVKKPKTEKKSKKPKTKKNNRKHKEKTLIKRAKINKKDTNEKNINLLKSKFCEALKSSKFKKNEEIMKMFNKIKILLPEKSSKILAPLLYLTHLKCIKKRFRKKFYFKKNKIKNVTVNVSTLHNKYNDSSVEEFNFLDDFKDFKEDDDITPKVISNINKINCKVDMK